MKKQFLLLTILCATTTLNRLNASVNIAQETENIENAAQNAINQENAEITQEETEENQEETDTTIGILIADILAYNDIPEAIATFAASNLSIEQVEAYAKNQEELTPQQVQQVITALTSSPAATTSAATASSSKVTKKIPTRP